MKIIITVVRMVSVEASGPCNCDPWTTIHSQGLHSKRHFFSRLKDQLEKSRPRKTNILRKHHKSQNNKDPIKAREFHILNPPNIP